MIVTQLFSCRHISSTLFTWPLSELNYFMYKKLGKKDGLKLKDSVFNSTPSLYAFWGKGVGNRQFYFPQTEMMHMYLK